MGCTVDFRAILNEIPFILYVTEMKPDCYLNKTPIEFSPKVWFSNKFQLQFLEDFVITMNTN